MFKIVSNNVIDECFVRQEKASKKRKLNCDDLGWNKTHLKHQFWVVYHSFCKIGLIVL